MILRHPNNPILHPWCEGYDFPISKLLDNLIFDFQLFDYDDWETISKYLIGYGRGTRSYLKKFHYDEMYKFNEFAPNKVWVRVYKHKNTIWIASDSDSYIIRGILSIIEEIYTHLEPHNMKHVDVMKFFDQIRIKKHLDQKKLDGITSVLSYIKGELDDDKWPYVKNFIKGEDR